MEHKGTNFALLAIVGIVAIVALVVLLKGPSQSYVYVPSDSSNQAGQILGQFGTLTNNPEAPNQASIPRECCMDENGRCGWSSRCGEMGACPVSDCGSSAGFV